MYMYIRIRWVHYETYCDFKTKDTREAGEVLKV